MNQQLNSDTTNQQVPPESNPDNENQFDIQGFFDLVAEAEQGNEFALQRVRQMMDTDVRLKTALGDLTAQLRLKLIRQVSGDELVRREAVESNLNDLLKRVEAENLQDVPSTIKELLLTALCLSWLELHLTEVQYSIHRHRRMVQRFWGDQLKASQRRYMAALNNVIEAGQRYAA
jgi:hypothetical protein